MNRENPSIAYYSAIENGNLEKVKELLSSDINPNVVNCEGMSPVDYAIKLNKWEIIKELNENDAKVYCESLSEKYIEI
jgi:ankyrin repeat protein